MSSDEHKLTVEGDRKVAIADDGVVPIILNNGAAPATAMAMSASVAIDAAAERRLVWKFDLWILPTLAIMYLFNALVSHDLPYVGSV